MPGLKLRVLFVEDREEDALQLVNELYRGGFDPADMRVETEKAFRAALAEQVWDVIISDFNLPDFSGPDALRIFNKSGLDIPFIMVSGTVGEEAAVDSLRAGAKDFIAKTKLDRFLPALNRELAEFRIRAEKAASEKVFREREYLLTTVINTMEEGAVITDTAEKIIFTNPKIEAIFGAGHGELVGRSFKEFLSPEEVRMVREQTRDRKKGKSNKYELQITRDDGKSRNILLTASPIIDSEGKVNRTFAIVQDITKLKKAEAEQKLLVKAIEQSLDTVVITDVDGSIRYVNPAFETITGYSEKEVLGKNPNLIKSGRHKKKFYRNMWETLLSGHTWRGRLTNKKKNGDLFTEEASISPVRADDGDTIAYVAVKHDITHRIRTEQEIMESRNKIQAITKSAVDAIIMIDAEGLTTFWNPAAEKIFGYSKEEILGQNFHSVIVPERYLDAHRAAFDGFIRTGNGPAIGKSLELAGIRKDQSEIPIELSLSGVKISGEWHAVGIIKDISDRKKLEMQLMQANKLESIGQLAAGIAHEINTPTQYVGDNTHFLKDAFADFLEILPRYKELQIKAETGNFAPELTSHLNKLYQDLDMEYLLEEIPTAIEQSLEGIDRISHIVKAMKEFSHPGEKEKSPTDINSAINTTITVSKNVWKYVADMETDLDPGLPQILCLVNEFNQVILNMISNASHAIGEALGESPIEKGRINITTRYSGKWVEILVGDTGAGIPESARDKIFDPFFTTKGVSKGTGQGLSISYDIIVNKHGGELSFETEVGSGTTFLIKLPVIENS